MPGLTGDHARTANAPTRSAFLTPMWPSESAANGVATYVDHIVGGLRRIGQTPTIISAATGLDDLPSDVYVVGQQPRSHASRLLDPVAFRICPARAFRWRFGANVVSATRRAIVERGVQLLEMEESLGMAQLVKHRLPIPVIVRLHGPRFVAAPALKLSLDAADRRAMRHERTALLRVDAISAPSHDILERTRAHYELLLPQAVVIPNPAPVVAAKNRWQLSACRHDRILFVGRFDRLKGGDLAIDSMRTVLREFPDVRLWFVGPDRGFVDNRGQSWTLPQYLAKRAPDVAPAIESFGQQPRAAVEDLRRQSFLTVVASRYETLGMVVLEAMAHGCPVVVPRAGGLAETIEDGVSGLFCQPGDANDLAAAVIRLLRNQELAATLGAHAAQRAASRHSPDEIARETNAFHRAAIERSREAGRAHR